VCVGVRVCGSACVWSCSEIMEIPADGSSLSDFRGRGRGR